MAIPEENMMRVNKIKETDEYQDFVHVRWILRNNPNEVNPGNCACNYWRSLQRK